MLKHQLVINLLWISTLCAGPLVWVASQDDTGC